MSPRARTWMVALAVGAGLGVAGAFLPVGHAEIDAQPTPEVSLEIRGSGAMGQLARAVAEQFMKEHEGTIVTVQTCGAHQGLKALVVGSCGLAMGTDEVPEDLEKLARETGVKLQRTDIYKDAIVVAVHPLNPVRGLSTRQLRDVFRGAVANWKDVGGPDAAIEVLTPSTTSAGYEVFKRRVLGADAVMTPKAVTVKTRELRAGLPVHGIVYLGLAQFVRLNRPEAQGAEGKPGREEAVSADVQVDCASPPPAAPVVEAKGEAAGAPPAAKVVAQGVAIDGVCPSTATVRDGTYSIVRTMSLYRRETAPPLAGQVVEHFLDPKKGRLLVLKEGNVPVK